MTERAESGGGGKTAPRPPPKPAFAGPPPPARMGLARPAPLPSVRETMRGARPPAPPRPGPAAGVAEPPPRRIEVDGRPWTIRQQGAASVGAAGSLARVISVELTPRDAPGGPRLARYVPARSLEEVGDEELAALVRAAGSSVAR